MANSTDTLGEKGESEKRSGFWLAFCLVGKFVQSSDGLAVLFGKETKCNFRPRGIRGYGGDNSCAWSLRIIHGAVIGWLLVVVKGRFFLTGGDPGY